METLFHCQIRSMRGAPILVPDGGKYMIRARVREGLLPQSFRLVSGRASLRVAVRDVESAGDKADGVIPIEGVPEEIIGVVAERIDGGLLIDAGFLVQAMLPTTALSHRCGLGERVCCTVEGQTEVDQLVLDAGQ